jgi:hypothetical protein
MTRSAAARSSNARHIKAFVSRRLVGDSVMVAAVNAHATDPADLDSLMSSSWPPRRHAGTLAHPQIRCAAFGMVLP